MKTLSIAIQKGGQGKTLVTCHLAFDFHERGLNVVVLDLDTQGNASFTLSAYKGGVTASDLFHKNQDKMKEALNNLFKRQHQTEEQATEEKHSNRETNLHKKRGLSHMEKAKQTILQEKTTPKNSENKHNNTGLKEKARTPYLIRKEERISAISLAPPAAYPVHKDPILLLVEADEGLADLDRVLPSEARENLRQKIELLSHYFDVCIIDTPPSMGIAMVCSILTSDFILCPLEPEAYSLHGMKKMVSVMTHLRQKNPKLVFLGMLPNKVDTRKPRHVSNLSLIVSNWPDLVTPASLSWRDSFAQALGERIPVWRIQKTAARKAAKEIRALGSYVLSRMFGSPWQ